VPADGVTPRLGALSALLDSAHQLAQALESEPTIRRVLEALAVLPPDDRETLAVAIERGVAWRKLNQGVSEAIGVRLRVNPNPRLFIRVIDGKEPTTALVPDSDDVLISIFRVMRLAPILARDEARAAWEPAAEEALGMLTPDERQACLHVGRAALGLIERIVAHIDRTDSDA
jgi:hypothetical protein